MKKCKYIFLVIAVMLVLNIEVNTAPTVYASNSNNMSAYYIIDNEGYYTETVYLIKQDGVDYSKYIETEPSANLKKPKWDGTQWMEGYVEPVQIPDEIDEEVNQNVSQKTNLLATTDKADQEDISLVTDKVVIESGTSYKIDLVNTKETDSYVWTSSNSKVVKVDKIGKIKSIKKGKATIVCIVTSSDDEVTILKCKVTVK